MPGRWYLIYFPRGRPTNTARILVVPTGHRYYLYQRPGRYRAWIRLRSVRSKAMPDRALWANPRRPQMPSDQIRPRAKPALGRQAFPQHSTTACVPPTRNSEEPRSLPVLRSNTLWAKYLVAPEAWVPGLQSLSVRTGLGACL